jgi:hypothetical protein
MLAVMVGAQALLPGLVSHFTPPGVRPLVTVSAAAIAMMTLAAAGGETRQRKVAAILLSTLVSAVCVYAWRRVVDPLGFLGAVPAAFELLTLGTIAGLTAALATAVALLPVRTRRGRRVQWACVVMLSGVLIAGLTYMSEGMGEASTSVRLQQVVQLESMLETSGRNDRQELSFLLAVFGRGGESQAFSTRHAQPYGRDEQAAEGVTDPAKITSAAVPWRQAVREIAAKERIVIIMEAHNATEHREWIEQTLPIFHKAGFRHYASEALFENGTALRSRGFPVEATGYYVADPRFGNLLRRALALEYSIHEYEAHLASDPQDREEQQARALASIVAANPSGKLLVHAGLSHVFKKPQPGFGRWMAARLWDLTGIEPYCIYQAYDNYDSPRYRQVVALAGATEEPRLLIPPPSGLRDPQFADVPIGAVDAIVIHPAIGGKPPTSRKPTFTEGMTRVPARWLEDEWPVVVGAYRPGEPADAIALDQVLLRQGESDFELWIPDGQHELRVTSTMGFVKIAVERDFGVIHLRRGEAKR